MAEWIDVRCGLPKRNVRVLVYLKENACDYTRIDTDRRIDDGQWVRWGNNVTNWMSLPEPPVPQLKFCPLCGFVAAYDEYQQDGIRVRCTHCGHKTEFYSNKIEASDDWNSQ